MKILTDYKIHRPAVLFFFNHVFLVSGFFVSAPFFLPRPVRSGLVSSSRLLLSIYAAPAARSPIHGLTCCQVLQCMIDPLPGVSIRSLHISSAIQPVPCSAAMPILDPPKKYEIVKDYVEEEEFIRHGTSPRFRGRRFE
ncbi:hypothetical protein TNCT_97931 [Trichonephila clavata]|uniref:Uncharacterized protein n=1 Tax=Trichonephila clavata TaxID=2740835 RepID=A0A8X6G8U7_TRICU|nr:hypothetical protein TNCT_97931 [Trichonephila clavata]